MNGKRNTTLAVVGILVIVGALLSIVIRLMVAVDEGRAEARAAFDALVPSLGQPGAVSGLSDRERRLGLINMYAADSRLLLVWVADRDRGILWRLPDRSAYLPSSENLSRFPRVEAPAYTTELFSADWSGEGRRAEIDALYVTLSQEKAFVIFRDAAIGLGAWLLVALFVILLGGGEGERVTWRQGAAQSERAEAIVSSEFGSTRKIDAAQEEGEGSEEDDFEGTEPGAGDFAGIQGKPDRFSEPENFEIPELERSETNAPKLYSPASGLGYASWLDERLSSELSRAAAIEQDLSLLVMTLDGLTPDREDYDVVALSLREFFSFRDLAFERGESGFSVILPNLDAAHALRMAEEFHKKLTIQIRGREDGGLQTALPLYMGLSSRAGRLVEARRLMDEAGLALERAREENDSKIVAFKPDPDKYRLWLASMGNY